MSARCGTCNEEIKPDALTGTTCKCAQAPVAFIAQCELDFLRIGQAYAWLPTVWSRPTGQAGVPLYTAPTAQAIAELIAAGDRLTDAFRALGTSTGIENAIRRTRECEASMLAFSAALARAKAGGA